ALVLASQNLKHFCIAPAATVPVRDQLAELRAEARHTAGLISQSPAGVDTLWIFNKPATHAEYLRRRELEGSNTGEPTLCSIQWCQLTWGQFWQDRPEDFLALCRQMVTNKYSGAFALNFLRAKNKELDVSWHLPRLMEPNSNERARVDQLWSEFLATP